MPNHCHTCKKGLPLLGRALISLIFIVAGIGKIVDFSGAVSALKQVGVPGSEFYVVVGFLMELVGGALILLGWHTRLGCWILMIFLLPTTILFHGFWNMQGADAALQFSLFLKNLTIYGGLTLLLSYGPGKWSVDALTADRAD